MDDSILFMILLQVVLIGMNAIFACAEIAVISLNDNKLKKMAEEGDRRAVRLVRLTEQPSKFLSTIQVAITLSGFLGSAFAAENFSDHLVKLLINLGIHAPEKTLDTISVVFITIVLSYFTLIFGELVPKRVAMKKAEKLSFALSTLLSGIAKLFAPVVWFLTISTNSILRVLGIDPDEQDEEVSEEEIRMMVDVGSEKGTIDHEEKEFIQNVFEFDDLTAGEIVTHRTEVSFLNLEDSMEEWEQIIHDTRHTLYPVCDDVVDEIVGILNAKDYFRLEERSRKEVLRHAVKPAYFVPESIKADVLFRNMRHTRNKLAIVFDEYGGLKGIITLNDLVERLVGDLGDDETEAEEVKFIEKIDRHTWKILGRTPIEDVEEALGISLESDDHDTFNGYVFSALGTMPQDGATAQVDLEQLQIHVTEIAEHQIKTAIVRLKESKEAEEAEM